MSYPLNKLSREDLHVGDCVVNAITTMQGRVIDIYPAEVMGETEIVIRWSHGRMSQFRLSQGYDIYLEEP